MARAQLLAIGLGSRAIDHRLESGRLHALHRGVYAVGHRVLTRDGQWIAAVLAAGPDAVLSHYSAAVAWGLLSIARERIDVAVPRTVRSRPGVRLHQLALPADERTLVRGLPVTTPPRTLLDLAAVAPPRHLERAFGQAEMLRLTDRLSLPDLLARHPGRRGAAAIRRILDDDRIGNGVTRSDLEDLFLTILDTAGLPRPEINADARLPNGTWVEVDCMWRRERVVVELDGYDTHRTRLAFEHDRARDRALQVAGWRVVRITWRQLLRERRTLESELRSLLSLAI